MGYVQLEEENWVRTDEDCTDHWRQKIFEDSSLRRYGSLGLLMNRVFDVGTQREERESEENLHNPLKNWG